MPLRMRWKYNAVSLTQYRRKLSRVFSKDLSSPDLVIRWKYIPLRMKWKNMPRMMRVGNNAVSLTQYRKKLSLPIMW